MTAKQKPQTFAEIQRLWSRDVPIWLASGRIDAIQLLSDHLTIEGEGAARVTNPPGIDAAMYRGARVKVEWSNPSTGEYSIADSAFHLQPEVDLVRLHRRLGTTVFMS